MCKSAEVSKPELSEDCRSAEGWRGWTTVCRRSHMAKVSERSLSNRTRCLRSSLTPPPSMLNARPKKARTATCETYREHWQSVRPHLLLMLEREGGAVGALEHGGALHTVQRSVDGAQRNNLHRQHHIICSSSSLGTDTHKVVPRERVWLARSLRWLAFGAQESVVGVLLQPLGRLKVIKYMSPKFQRSRVYDWLSPAPDLVQR